MMSRASARVFLFPCSGISAGANFVCIFSRACAKVFCIAMFAPQRERNILICKYFRAPAREYFLPPCSRVSAKEIFWTIFARQRGRKICEPFSRARATDFSFNNMSRADVLCLGWRCRPWPRAPLGVGASDRLPEIAGRLRQEICALEAFVRKMQNFIDFTLN